MGEGEELLKNKIDEIKKRPTIADLIQRKFSFAMGSFSYLNWLEPNCMGARANFKDGFLIKTQSGNYITLRDPQASRTL